MIATAALVLAALAPLAINAATVDAKLVPDGTYTVKVEKVNDAQHILVKMDNGMEAELAAKGAVNFGSVKANDTLTVSIIQGKVPVYRVK